MSYEFLKEDWESGWAPHRDLLAWIFGLTILNGPGLYWLYVLVDAFQSAESSAYWFAPTPAGGTSVFAQNVGAFVLFVLWTAIVLSLFSRPLSKTLGELRG